MNYGKNPISQEQAEAVYAYLLAAPPETRGSILLASMRLLTDFRIRAGNVSRALASLVGIFDALAGNPPPLFRFPKPPKGETPAERFKAETYRRGTSITIDQAYLLVLSGYSLAVIRSRSRREFLENLPHFADLVGISFIDGKNPI